MGGFGNEVITGLRAWLCGGEVKVGEVFSNFIDDVLFERGTWVIRLAV
jgi:hypothetical protein